MGERARCTLVGAGLVLAVFAIYAVTLGHDFVLYDDDQYVYENRYVAGGMSWEAFRHFLTNPHSINWHPLTSLSHMLDVELFGLDPAGHHAVNVVLHALASVLLFGALRSLHGSTWMGASVAALFAVHPLRAESVAWISERKDVLSGVFFAASLWAYAIYARRSSLGRWWAVTATFALGLAAKPMLVTTPALFLLLDHWPLARGKRVGLRRLVLEKLPWFALCVLVAALTLSVQAAAGAVRPVSEHEFDAATRIATAARGSLTYLGQTLWPSGLAFFHPHPALIDPTYRPFGPPTLIALGLLVLVTAAACALRRRTPALLTGWLWFLGMLLPVSGLLQAGEQAWADRYAYLPTIGLYLAAAAVVGQLARRFAPLRRSLGPAFVLVLVALGLRAHAQAGTWRTSESLFEHALRVTDGNYMAWNNLGLVRLGRADVGGAREAFEQALAIRPGDVKAQVNLALALASAGEPERAEASLAAILVLHPRLAQAHSNLGSLCARRGAFAEARLHYERALEVDPDLVGARFHLGVVQAELGEEAAARASFEATLRLDPHHVQARERLARLRAEGSTP